MLGPKPSRTLLVPSNEGIGSEIGGCLGSDKGYMEDLGLGFRV